MYRRLRYAPLLGRRHYLRARRAQDTEYAPISSQYAMRKVLLYVLVPYVCTAMAFRVLNRKLTTTRENMSRNVMFVYQTLARRYDRGTDTTLTGNIIPL